MSIQLQAEWRFKSSGMWWCVVGRVVLDVSKDHSVFIVRVKQFKNPDDEETMMLRNVGYYLPNNTLNSQKTLLFSNTNVRTLNLARRFCSLCQEVCFVRVKLPPILPVSCSSHIIYYCMCNRPVTGSSTSNWQTVLLFFLLWYGLLQNLWTKLQVYN
jgi:hypothetical protein